MLRTFACLATGLILVAASALVAEDNKVGKDQADAKDLQGKVVRVDPQKGVIVIRNAAGKEQEFTMGQNAKYFGNDNKALSEGLRSNLLREGANVRYRTGQGNTINELRLAPPPGANKSAG